MSCIFFDVRNPIHVTTLLCRESAAPDKETTTKILERQDALEFKESKIYGKGWFATHNLKKNQWIRMDEASVNGFTDRAMKLPIFSAFSTDEWRKCFLNYCTLAHLQTCTNAVLARVPSSHSNYFVITTKAILKGTELSRMYSLEYWIPLLFKNLQNLTFEVVQSYTSFYLPYKLPMNYDWKQPLSQGYYQAMKEVWSHLSSDQFAKDYPKASKYFYFLSLLNPQTPTTKNKKERTIPKTQKFLCC